MTTLGVAMYCCCFQGKFKGGEGRKGKRRKEKIKRKRRRRDIKERKGAVKRWKRKIGKGGGRKEEAKNKQRGRRKLKKERRKRWKRGRKRNTEGGEGEEMNGGPSIHQVGGVNGLPPKSRAISIVKSLEIRCGTTG